NSMIRGTVGIATADTCAGANFESLLIDGVPSGSYSVGTVSYNTTKLSNGVHQFQVDSQSMNPGSVTLGSASRSFNVQNFATARTQPPAPAPAQQATLSQNSQEPSEQLRFDSPNEASPMPVHLREPHSKRRQAGTSAGAVRSLRRTAHRQQVSMS